MSGAPPPSQRPPEYHFVLLGSHDKTQLFEKLNAVALKFERHVNYPDVFYLTFPIDNVNCVVEISDPGLVSVSLPKWLFIFQEHTGAREMAIRKAEAVILVFSTYSSQSYQQLSNIVPDFKVRLNKGKTSLPVVVIGNEELEEDDGGKADIDSVSSSEGYESEENTPQMVPNERRRRNSMEAIAAGNQTVVTVTTAQGEQLAKQFGSESRYLQLSLSKFENAGSLIENLIRAVNARRKRPSDGKRFKRPVVSTLCTLL